MKDWRYYFSLTHLERGNDLYYRGFVQNFSYDKHKVYATVGKEKVVLYLKDGQVEDMHCSCRLDQCPHQVALMLAYEQRQHLFLSHFFSGEQLIQQLTVSQKDELLLNLFNESDDLLMYANRMLGQKQTLSDQKQYEVHQLIFQYNKDGIVYPLQLFVHQLLEKKPEQEDIYLYQLLLNRLKVLEKDVQMTSLLTQILEGLASYLKLYPEYQSTMFEFLKNDYENELFLDFLYDQFRYEPYLSIKLELINQYIKQVEAYQAWGKDYYLERYLIKKLQVLYDMKNTDEMNKILNDYFEYPKIREFFIVGAMKNDDYSSAISLIKESQRLDQNNPYLLIQYQNYLIDLYEQIDPSAYFETLKKQLFEIDPGCFEIYLKFKKACPKQLWPHYFNELIHVEMEEGRLLDLLFEEQEYRLMFKRILETKNIYYLEKKKHLLFRRCPSEFYDVYEMLIQE